MKNHHVKHFFLRKRYFALIAILLFLSAMLIFRLGYLTIVKQDFLLHQGTMRSVRIEEIPAFRGMITDRMGKPLAVSTPVDSIWINPQEFDPADDHLMLIAKRLKLSVQEIKEKLSRFKHRQFMYLKRGVPPEIGDEIKTLKLSGVYFQREYKRYYPEGPMTAQLVGFTNIDGKGQEGVELGFNKILAGRPGKQVVVKDRMGHIVGIMQSLQDQEPGNNIQLTIDNRIQYAAYNALKDGVTEFGALAGSVVVLDPKTEEILAIANYPSYNPNFRPKQMEGGHYRNRSVTDLFEPGSTIKAFSVMSALDSGKYSPNTIIHTSPGWLRVGENVVRDEHDNQDLTVTQVIQRSSNVGVTKMTLSLPPKQFYSLLSRVGFGEKTQSQLPGEASGVLVPKTTSQPFELATLGFGYGLSVTPLQLAHAYGIIANGGIKRPVSIIIQPDVSHGERVIDSGVASEMMEMLKSVLSVKGTGSRAQIPHYQVAGKTGTAKVAGPHGYYAHKYNASFVGIAPATQPRLVVAVVIFQPRKKSYYGGVVAAPIFAKVMSSALRILDIPSDEVQNVSVL